MFTHNSGCECSHMAEGQEGIVGVWVTVRTLVLNTPGFLYFFVTKEESIQADLVVQQL